jgi:site-specific DNA-methyltransferase (adenine-specific)
MTTMEEQEPVWCIEQGDCLDVLKKLPDDCVDAVVTDPPAGIAFMGKAWDRMKREGMTELQAFQEFIKDVFSEVYRVLKPGGHAVVWALPRTSHHTAMGLERAGFDIRDNGTYLFHVFGSGFPKSHNVGLSIDKAQGHGNRGRAIPTASSYQACDMERENKLTSNPVERYTGKTEAGQRYAGFGTALKPAVEFWILARKPLEGTVAGNVLEYGTGALNIDECRISTEENLNGGAYAKNPSPRRAGAVWGADRENPDTSYARGHAGVYVPPSGRWPAHLILDEGAAALLDEQSPPSQSRKGKPRKSKAPGDGWGMTATGAEYDDAGGASRFFYVAKASTKDKDEGLDDFVEKSPGEKTERQEGSIGISPYAGSRGPSRNVHPTVKPTELMRYLVRLVTPPGGVVLDPFMGSGSTGKAAILEGFSFVGIEREDQYLEIARARLRHADAKNLESVG